MHILLSISPFDVSIRKLSKIIQIQNIGTRVSLNIYYTITRLLVYRLFLCHVPKEQFFVSGSNLETLPVVVPLHYHFRFDQ